MSETLVAGAARAGADVEIDLGLSETGEVENGPSSSIPHKAACLDVVASWRVGAKYGECGDAGIFTLVLDGVLEGGNGRGVCDAVPEEMGMPAYSFQAGAEVRR